MRLSPTFQNYRYIIITEKFCWAAEDVTMTPGFAHARNCIRIYLNEAENIWLVANSAALANKTPGSLFKEITFHGSFQIITQ